MFKSAFQWAIGSVIELFEANVSMLNLEVN